MNTMCNTLTKRVVARALRTSTMREGKQLLPSKDTAIFVNKRKRTRNLAIAVQYDVSNEKNINILPLKKVEYTTS